MPDKELTSDKLNPSMDQELSEDKEIISGGSAVPVMEPQKKPIIMPTSENMMPKLPDWLQNLDTPEKSTTKYPDWFTNLKIDQKSQNAYPILEINGPSIQLPSFPILSDKLKLFSAPTEEKAEQRTAEADSAFDLTFFPQQQSKENAEFPLLSNQHDLSDLETTTTPQIPMVTQGFSPLENRQALTQLVSLYEKVAPNLKNSHNFGEMDKNAEKPKIEEMITNDEMHEDDTEPDKHLDEEKDE